MPSRETHHRCRSGLPMQKQFITADSVMRILLVDDEPLLLKSFTRYLGSVCGHDVVCTNGGGEALAHFENGEGVDLILCDLTMPDIDGAQVHRALCEDYPEWHGRFVFLTGGVTDEVTDSYVQNAGVPVLSKPIRQVTLDKVLADVSGV